MEKEMHPGDSGMTLAAYLVNLGFTQQLAVDQCLFVHKERQIDFGLYVDDTEWLCAAANHCLAVRYG